MRIGIVGGGAAGLTSAWLLQEQHEVTLFEKDDRFGGHAHTVEVEAHGQRVPINTGFEFFSAGGRHTFDHLVFACNANQALKLLEPNAGLEVVCEQLRRFEYFETTIAVHGDRRLMPRSESAWSVVNVCWDGVHSSISVWNPQRGLPIFRSWVTYEATLPDSLYALVKYQHGKITVDYFDAQKRLKALQGQNNLWLAGLYTYDADSHESAVRSAVVIAERLAPESSRLKLLKG